MEGRYGSLNLACQINFGRNFASTSVSGNVYNDTDGFKDNSISTVITSTAAAKTNAGGLFANLVDTNGFVVSSVAVGASGTAGTYSFPTVVTGNYTVRISTVQGIESSAAPANTLPAGWSNTGEFLGKEREATARLMDHLPLRSARRQ